MPVYLPSSFIKLQRDAAFSLSAPPLKKKKKLVFRKPPPSSPTSALQTWSLHVV